MCAVQINVIVHTILAFYPPAINHNQWKKIISLEAQQTSKNECAGARAHTHYSNPESIIGAYLLKDVDGKAFAHNYYLPNAEIERLNSDGPA